MYDCGVVVLCVNVRGCCLCGIVCVCVRCLRLPWFVCMSIVCGVYDVCV